MNMNLQTAQNILITGCSKGIGLKLVELLLSVNDKRRVFATCRKPENATQLQDLLQLYPDRLKIDSLDVSQEETIKTYVEKMKNQNVKFHILINNAGTFSPNRFETLLNATKQDMLSVYETNCIGPLLMVQHLYNNHCFEDGAIVANVSSGMASINRTNRPRKRVSYCCSKTALNMLTKMMSIELEGHVYAFAIHPGWVKTDTGTDKAPLTTQEAVPGIIKLLDDFTPETHNGKFFQYDGSVLNW
ncbi:hypothetical protein C9374_004898 [Naegleria lovaniensis]|uniref:C-factor n=1 Tax=Naegleria lovaniensis TaxID=51637 RepID=A0AA88GPJ9_NAELO|nr:uncharacterized protein C9374_004898 [Naegleria lovaniensis]KAG2382931.1 hypothetical protein C9374_004898 [Naegleria lovaniensis]